MSIKNNNEILVRLVKLEERMSGLTEEVGDLKNQFKQYFNKIFYAFLVLAGALAGINLIKP